MQSPDGFLGIFQNLDISSIFQGIPFLQNFWFRTLIFVGQILLGAFGIFFFVFIVYALLHTSWLREKMLEDITEFTRYKAYGLHRRERQWQRIMRRLEMANEGEWKLSILEADQMLDEVLQRLQVRGASPDERLVNATEPLVPDLASLKEAHTVRNNIVHDPDYRLRKDEAMRVLRLYEEVLTGLDLI
ncbi:MAG: hypothetical protein HYW95_01005 [Candidatus Wildermuthbacteria bacterium]|nr:hypothetical protein [Candidatus Wildermuthbacteria bacterium]